MSAKWNEMKNFNPATQPNNANLSADAKTLLTNIHAAKVDGSLTFQQTCDKVNG